METAGDRSPLTWGGIGRVDKELGGDQRTVDLERSHELGVGQKSADPPGFGTQSRCKEGKLAAALLLSCLVRREVDEEQMVAPGGGAGRFKAKLLGEVALEERRGVPQSGKCVGGPEGIVRSSVGK